MSFIPPRSTLKTAKAKVQTDVNGDGTILLKVPGTVGVKSRLIQGGSGWFENADSDDWVKISISDEDNILGGGAGVEVGKYYDEEVAADNQGWFIPYHKKYLDMDAIADMAELIGGLYLKIVVKKGTAVQDWFHVNIKWGSID